MSESPTEKKLLFEISWEVCNMVGGIHTVIVSKIAKMQEFYGDDYILIGPDTSNFQSLKGIFVEDIWHAEMKKALDTLPIEVKMGRWQVPGQPRCLLLNFESLFSRKDEILGGYWERYGLNSLTGGYDYVEPVLFGQAAGMVIEKLVSQFLLPQGFETIAHCHEWLASIALLYLKDRAPEVGTVFTTHATMMGRTLSSHRWDQNLSDKESIQPDYLAQQYGIVAKHSLETVSARQADCFSTVSEITGAECEAFYRKKPDSLLLNALGKLVPDPSLLEPENVQKSRQALLHLAAITTGHNYDAERTTFFIAAGRYEFKNKGIDVTLDTLSRLNQRLKEADHGTGEHTVAFMMFPADHTGPRPKVLEAHSSGRLLVERYYSTHGIRNEEHDPIMTRMAPLGFRNGTEDPVHIIFIPIYLNGADPLIQQTYYQLLAGADLTLFPSFYEPWGYTPLESVALSVPTITSDLAGFGAWAGAFGDFTKTGVHVLKRRGVDHPHVVDEMTNVIMDYLGRSAEARAELRKMAFVLGKKARWESFGEEYRKAHIKALEGAKQRMSSATYDRFRSFSTVQPSGFVTSGHAHIRRFIVKNKLPAELEQLRQLVTQNLWWVWNHEIADILSELDAGLWERCHRNPIDFLDQFNPVLLTEHPQVKEIKEKIEFECSRYHAYVGGKKPAEVVYFCMEYGITNILKLYSGGLGILAGDHLKTASDMNIPLCALGLNYKYGYFLQSLSPAGHQEHHYKENEHRRFLEPVLDGQGQRLKFSIQSPQGPIWMQAWRAGVGRVDLYLLDTDIAENKLADRNITDRLYGGDSLHRLRQEFVLAIGGHELLRLLNLKPRVFHMNEGHTAFLVISRITRMMQEEKVSFEEALEYVRHTTGFTTHTPVAAGHDQFPEGMVSPYLQQFADRIQQPISRLQDLGRSLDRSRENMFSMTLLAARGSRYINGVSKIHGKVSQRMFHTMVPQLHENEVPVRYVTNGVHAPSWIAPEFQKVFTEQLGPNWRYYLADEEYWQNLYQVDDQIIWDTHLQLKRNLLAWLRNHIQETWSRRHENPASLATALANLGEDTFIATFARRFAPYKRANLLFSDPHRLAKLLNGPQPAVFLFAGKAHPSDVLGQQMITRVLELARNPEFSGRILFVENYEIDVAKNLVWGSDLWINNPVRPLEASGTSGMKAGMNGCLNLSVADGWWSEAYNGRNGWIIGDESMTHSQEFQDTFDSAHLYALLEREVLPIYAGRSRGGVPVRWVEFMKQSMATIISRFNTERMLYEYERDFYNPSRDLAKTLVDSDFAEVKYLTQSRRRTTEHWETIAFEDIDVRGLSQDQILVGQQLNIEVTVKHPHLQADDLEVQIVFANDNFGASAAGFCAKPMKCKAELTDKQESVWHLDFSLEEPGQRSMGIRVIPKPCHALHSVDLTLDLIKWL